MVRVGSGGLLLTAGCVICIGKIVGKERKGRNWGNLVLAPDCFRGIG